MWTKYLLRDQTRASAKLLFPPGSLTLTHPQFNRLNPSFIILPKSRLTSGKNMVWSAAPNLPTPPHPPHPPAHIAVSLGLFTLPDKRKVLFCLALETPADTGLARSPTTISLPPLPAGICSHKVSLHKPRFAFDLTLHLIRLERFLATNPNLVH